MKTYENRAKHRQTRFLNDAKMSRRTFVKVSAAAGSSVALGGALKPTLKVLAETNKRPPKEIGEWIASTCQGCTS